MIRADVGRPPYPLPGRERSGNNRCGEIFIPVDAGAVTFSSREEMVELVAADNPTALQRRAILLDAADAEHPMGARLLAQRLVRLKQLHQAAATGDLALSDGIVAEVASALCDHQVRDACLTERCYLSHGT